MSTGSPETWSWDFDGDGTPDSADRNPSFTYTSPAAYTVALTVSNSQGNDTATGTITVDAPTEPPPPPLPPPTAGFSAAPTGGTAPLTVDFTDTSTGSPDTWSWDFDGDGTADSAERNPSHTYTGSGTYTVSLTVTNSQGSDTATMRDLVVVDVPPEPPPPPPPPPSPLTCAGYPGPPRVFLESQGWWREQNAVEPPEGRHIHLGTCFPLHQSLSGVVHFDLVIKLHGAPGTITLERIQVFDVLTVAKNIVLPCDQSTCEFIVPIDVDTRLVPDGNREFRMTANIRPEDATFGRRFYESTRWHAVIANGNSVQNGSESRTRSPGAAGWYDGVDYINVFCGYDDSGYRLLTTTLTAPFTLRCKFEGVDAFVSVDPNTHAQDFGTVIFQAASGGIYDVVIDPVLLAPGPHKLMVKTTKRNTNGEGAGVLVLPFSVAIG